MPRRILFLVGFECFAAAACITQPFFGTLFLLLLVFTRPQDDRPNMIQLHYQGVIFLSVLIGTLCRLYLVHSRIGRAFRGLRAMFLVLAIMWLSAMVNGYTPSSAYQVSEFATLPRTLVTLPPTARIVAMAATAISDAISVYSMAVAPP